MFKNFYFFVLTSCAPASKQLVDHIQQHGGSIIDEKMFTNPEANNRHENESSNYERALRMTHCIVCEDIEIDDRLMDQNVLENIKKRTQQLHVMKPDLYYVSEMWIRDCIQSKRLLSEKDYLLNERFDSMLPLSHATIFVNEIEMKENLERIVVLSRYLGAKLNNTLNMSCTHMITRGKNINNDFWRAYPNLKIVSYEWLNECAKTSELIDETSYLLVNRPISTIAAPLKRTSHSTSTLSSQSSSKFNGIDPSVNIEKAIMELRNEFRKFKIYIVTSDYNAVPLEDIIKTLESLGATVVHNYFDGNCTHVMARYMDSLDANRARRDGKELISLQWVDDCIRKLKLFDLDENILYRPLKTKMPIPELSNWRISVSGFNDIERSDVIYMIRSCGAKYSGDFSATHDCLIVSEKVLNDKQKRAKLDFALKEGIPAVSKEWLIKCTKERVLVPVKDYLIVPNQKFRINREESEQSSVHEVLEINPSKRKQPSRAARNNKKETIRIDIDEEEEEEKEEEEEEEKEEEEEDYQQKEVKYVGKSSTTKNSVAQRESAEDKKGKRKETFPSNRYNILLSTKIHDEKKRKEYQQIITNLGGNVMHDDSLIYCTHFIFSELRRTEKIFCACALGAWVLDVRFLEESNKKKKFVGEEPFELAPEEENTCSRTDSNYREKALPKLREWRQYIRQSGRKPFENKKVICLHMGGIDMKRILLCGGASSVVKKEITEQTIVEKKIASLIKNDKKDVSFVVYVSKLQKNFDTLFESVKEQLRTEGLNVFSFVELLDLFTNTPSEALRSSPYNLLIK
jgi:hypothetical protein